MPSGMDIFQLPDEILENILTFLSYDEVSRLRIVCKKFDQCCQRILNQGFLKVERYHAICLRDIKAQLPRRESERRDHALARHSDILTAIETRLSLLGMTFMKYVDMNLCCFIPGKVIDEIYNVLRYIQSTPTPPRSHEILQELRDISSMAMEHFDEHIAPLLKQKIGANRRTIALSSPSSSLSLVPSIRATGACMCPSLRRELAKLQLWVKQLNNSSIAMKKELVDVKVKFAEQRKRNKEQDKKMNELNQIIVELREQLVRVNEQEGKISEISRKLLECDRHISDLSADISQSRDDCIVENIQGSSSAKKDKDSRDASLKKPTDDKKGRKKPSVIGKIKPEKRQKCADVFSSSKRLKCEDPVESI